jgi:hypothetical protein
MNPSCGLLDGLKYNEPTSVNVALAYPGVPENLSKVAVSPPWLSVSPIFPLKMTAFAGKGFTVGIAVALGVGELRYDGDADTFESVGDTLGDELFDITMAVAPTINSTAKIATAAITYSFFNFRGGGLEGSETGAYGGGVYETGAAPEGGLTVSAGGGAIKRFPQRSQKTASCGFDVPHFPQYFRSSFKRDTFFFRELKASYVSVNSLIAK